jgi:hypothetical protein
MPKVKQEKELLEQIQKVTAKETNKHNISGLEERVSELRKAIMNQANNMEYDREAGELPPSMRDHTDELENITHCFYNSLENFMEQLHLTSTTNVRK